MHAEIVEDCLTIQREDNVSAAQAAWLTPQSCVSLLCMPTFLNTYMCAFVQRFPLRLAASYPAWTRPLYPWSGRSPKTPAAGATWCTTWCVRNACETGARAHAATTTSTSLPAGWGWGRGRWWWGTCRLTRATASRCKLSMGSLGKAPPHPATPQSTSPPTKRVSRRRRVNNIACVHKRS